MKEQLNKFISDEIILQSMILSYQRSLFRDRQLVFIQQEQKLNYATIFSPIYIKT